MYIERRDRFLDVKWHDFDVYNIMINNYISIRLDICHDEIDVYNECISAILLIIYTNKMI